MFPADTGNADQQCLSTFILKQIKQHGKRISVDFVNGIILFPHGRFIDLGQKTVILANHSLALQLLNHLVDGSSRVPVGAILSVMHCRGCDWYLLFFSPQQSHSRRAQSVLWQRLTGRRSSSEFFILGEEQKAHCKNFYPNFHPICEEKGTKPFLTSHWKPETAEAASLEWLSLVMPSHFFVRLWVSFCVDMWTKPYTWKCLWKRK